MEPETMLRARPAEERLADGIVPVPLSDLEELRRLLEVYDRERISEARARVRLLLGMGP